mmetsp:Transcript_21092/g.38504  ORF Transcript_21092/g.38504 Transcript_21092/m.38504 type:complete len:646 (+) Transcript_21092:50-1987(+)
MNKSTSLDDAGGLQEKTESLKSKKNHLSTEGAGHHHNAHLVPAANEDFRFIGKGLAWDDEGTDMIRAASKRSTASAYRSEGAAGHVHQVLNQLLQLNEEEHRQEEERIEKDLKHVAVREHGVRTFQSHGSRTRGSSMDFDKPDFQSRLRGWGHRLLSWLWFDFCIGMIILANAATIGAEAVAKTRDEDPSVWIRVLDVFFLCVYSIELFLRVFTYRMDAFRNHWVKFDGFLVITGYFDLCVLLISSQSGGDDSGGALDQIMLVRMLRLCRLARMVRFFTQFRVLWALVQGLMHSFNTLMWTWLLMFSLLYSFAILSIDIFPKESDDTATPEFREAASKFNEGLGVAMMTLSQFLWFDSTGRIYRPLIVEKPATVLFFAVFILVCSIALMNLVITVMVERHMEQSAQDKQAIASRDAERRKRMLPKLEALFHELDADGSGYVDLEEIHSAPQETQDYLQEIGKGLDIDELFKMLDYDGSGKLASREFCEGLVKASTSEKPLELLRLVSMSQEIMENSRDIADILRCGDVERGRIWRKKNKTNWANKSATMSDATSSKNQTPVQATKGIRPFKIRADSTDTFMNLGSVNLKIHQLEQHMGGLGSRVDAIEQNLKFIVEAISSEGFSRPQDHPLDGDEERRSINLEEA